MSRKCAITLEYCQEIGGSNALMLDVANVLKSEYGYEIHFHVFQLSDIVRSRFESAGHRVTDLLETDPFQLQGDYDLIWGAHWPVLGMLLLAGTVRFRNLVLHSMSPFVDFERMIFFLDEADLILFNSKENFNISSPSVTTHTEKFRIFPNSLPISFFDDDSCKILPRYDFSYVSNHHTPEIIDAMSILENRGYRVRKTGRLFGQAQVDRSYVDDSRVIISMGHTILKSVARKKHAYIYDRFGGPGYLTEDNFSEAVHRNFSGRYAGCKGAMAIVEDLLHNMPDRKNAEALHARAKQAFHLERNLAGVLDKLDVSRPWRMLDRHKHHSALIMCHSYHARRSGLVRMMPDTWFIPVLDVAHTHREVDVEIRDTGTWKHLEVKVPSFFRFSEMVRSFQAAVFILEPPEKAHIASIFAHRDDGEVIRGRSDIPSPHVARKFPGDARARRCGHQLILPLKPETRTVEILARDVEGKEHALACMTFHPADPSELPGTPHP